jgi:hypothetical protein
MKIINPFIWWLSLITGALSLFLLSSCNQKANEERKQKMDDFSQYVDTRRDSMDSYLDRNWDEMEREYSVKKAELEKDTAEMAEEMRANYYKTVSKWEDFKTSYQSKSQERDNIRKMDELRATLRIDGIRPDYTDLMAPKAVEEYRHFVKTVEAHKDDYTQDEWTVINVNWKALNGRKREIEEEIPAKDKSEITNLQIEYTAIKAVNRPMADNP